MTKRKTKRKKKTHSEIFWDNVRKGYDYSYACYVADRRTKGERK